MWDWSGSKGGPKRGRTKRTSSAPSRVPAPPQPGYAPAQAAYPPQQRGYPGPAAYPDPSQQPGYPPQQGQPYPPQQGYHMPPQPGYPGQPGYPPQGGYPPPQYPPQPGYPPQQHGGYPPQQPAGYPPPQHSGYPPEHGQMVGSQQPAYAVDDEQEERMWEWQFQQFDLPGMELQVVTFAAQTARWKSEMRKAFKRARRDFLKFVGYHLADSCTAAGIPDIGIKQLKRGRAPENFNVHMKIPLDYSGTNDFSNLCLLQTHPYHEDLHKFLDMQIARQPAGQRSRKLYIPIPEGKIYVPEGGVFIPGGKDKHDRSVYAGFLEDTFETIRLKSSVGRSADI
jgi:hypothetical protein